MNNVENINTTKLSVIMFIVFKCQRFIVTSTDFYLKLLITKNSVVKNQNLAVNHKSWPIKSNPAKYQKLFQNNSLCFMLSRFNFKIWFKLAVSRSVSKIFHQSFCNLELVSSFSPWGKSLFLTAEIVYNDLEFLLLYFPEKLST